MKTRYTNQPYYHHDNGFRSNGKKVSKGQWYHPVLDFTLVDLLQKLMMGIKRIFIAVKYQIFKNTQQVSYESASTGFLGKWKIPWFKIALIGIVIFLFTQKDFQFSINMKAPVGGADAQTSRSSKDNSAQQMNIAQAISFNDRNSARSNRKNSAAISLNDQEVETYIKRFRKVALMEMKKFGIPASIKMAWGILESQAGRVPFREADNNHFGPLMEGQPFSTAWENWRLHSVLLQEKFSGLFHNGLDYQAWIKAIDKAGVSNDRDFDKKLASLIERYQLYLLDQEQIQY